MRCSLTIAVLVLCMSVPWARAQSPTTGAPPKAAEPAPPAKVQKAAIADDELARLDAEVERIVEENDRQMADLAAKFRPGGKDLIPATFSGRAARELAEHAGVQFVLWRIFKLPGDAKGGVILAIFSSAESVDLAVKSRLPGNCGYVACGNTIAVQACPTEDWEKVAVSCTDPAAKRGRSPERSASANDLRMAKDTNVMIQLDIIANQLELFRAREGDYPDVLGKQWKELISEGFLKDAPMNPFSPKDVASKIVPKPAKGTVSPKQAGWVFDDETGLMWATGIGD